MPPLWPASRLVPTGDGQRRIELREVDLRELSRFGDFLFTTARRQQETARSEHMQSGPPIHRLPPPSTVRFTRASLRWPAMSRASVGHASTHLQQ